MVTFATIVFWALFVIGGLTLWHLNRPRTQASNKLLTSARLPQDRVIELMAGQKLMPAERREWLDRFLLDQQQDQGGK